MTKQRMIANKILCAKGHHITEYKQGRKRNFFLYEGYGGYLFLDHETSGCGYTVKCTDDAAEMDKFIMENGFKVVAIHTF